ncbi:thioredoxin domain-containing protein 11 [Phycodurus eques]|uniref:thioredoxin domain-containing protein 11 n=1 Tax=Phycodurus eques TaxID=693459 RepID=UPI002ACE876D|nr:thioredoxin domain-containing protein 11 [Phycodurus eques]
MLRRARLGLRQVLSLMARRPALLCGAIVLGVLLVLAVKFTCSRAKNVVAAARPPLRFFSPESPVVDLYLGQLDQVERLRNVAEVSFVFFYAPWCAHSMAARQEVQLVAKKLSKQVQFVAINCWWSQGKCRRLNHFYKYPIIHLFYRRFGPIEYKGPFVAAYVESFILRVITPLTYLPSRVALREFLSCHEPRVVGFFQFTSSPQPPGYITYLASALQALKRDFRGVVRFGVVTNRQVAGAISLKDDETVYLHRRFNSSLIFPRRERNFTSRAVCGWVFEHHESVLQWLQPPGTKSRLLEEELTKGAALLLFLPHDPLVSVPDGLLQQVADVALRYHSCDTQSQHLTSSSPCCHSVPVPDSAVRCEVCPSSSARCSLPSALRSAHKRRCLRFHCSSFLLSYSPLSQHSACCGNVHPRRKDISQTEEASRVRNSSPSTATSSFDALKGLRCQTNKTLRFYVLDVDLNWPLAERLGAPGNGNGSLRRHRNADVQGDGSFVAIVNLKDEVHYVLQRSPAATLAESLEAFIRNFSAPYNLLHRHLVGEDSRERRATSQDRSQQPEPPRPLIAELTTSSFLPCVMDLEKDVLLFYYTQWCGFCSVLNHVLIQLARLLQRDSGVTVARVNVARNDLPWEFMVDRVPTILFFPRYGKQLSVKFPDDLRITLPNLLRFILKHSGSRPDTDEPRSPDTRDASGPGGAVLRAEFESLRHEVRALHRARELLSQQLAQLWRDNRQLRLDARDLAAQNAELRKEQRSLEERRREKSRQLGEALRRLRELADASENLLNQNALLRIVIKALKEEDAEVAEPEEGKDASETESHLAS